MYCVNCYNVVRSKSNKHTGLPRVYCKSCCLFCCEQCAGNHGCNMKYSIYFNNERYEVNDVNMKIELKTNEISLVDVCSQVLNSVNKIGYICKIGDSDRILCNDCFEMGMKILFKLRVKVIAINNGKAYYHLTDVDKVKKENKMDKFWMVKSENSNYTSAIHNSYDSAEKESKRLASTTPGVKFYVLEAISYAESIDPVKVVKLEEIPF